MTAAAVRLACPDGKPYWIVYGVRRISDGRLVYIGQTSFLIWARWAGHCQGAVRTPVHRLYPLLVAIREHTPAAFSTEELACCRSRQAAGWTEHTLIEQHKTLLPDGYNSANAIRGGTRSTEFVVKHSTSIKAAHAARRNDPERWTTWQAANKLRGEATRLAWQDPETRPARLAKMRATVIKGVEKVRATTKAAWADPAKRPGRLAQLRRAQEVSRQNRRARAKSKEGRQRDLF